MNKTLPVLYILIRNELNSMNPGKLAAQASHASNAFIHDANRRKSWDDVKTLSAVQEWETSTQQGFGTVLTLEGKMTDIETTTQIFKDLGYIADVVHDPTYPIVDGEIVHFVPLNTCSYVFVPDKLTDKVAKCLLEKYHLHR